jgi:hypothetical protein
VSLRTIVRRPDVIDRRISEPLMPDGPGLGGTTRSDYRRARNRSFPPNPPTSSRLALQSRLRVNRGGCSGHHRFLLFDPKAAVQDAQASSGSALDPTIPQVRRQDPEPRDQNAARGLMVDDGPSTPALSDRPLAHAALQADDMPHARTRRAADPAQRGHRLVHATARVELPFVQLRLSSR